MRRRFSRRRRPGGGDGRSPIDGTSVVAKILEQQIVDAEELVPLEREDIPDTFAALARGSRPNGTPLVVGYAPLGGDAISLMGKLPLSNRSLPLLLESPSTSSGCEPLPELVEGN